MHIFRQVLYKTGNLLEYEHTFVVGVTAQGELVRPSALPIAPARGYTIQGLTYGFRTEWVTHRISLLYKKSDTFTPYVFSAYPIDGKPAFSSFKERVPLRRS